MGNTIAKKYGIRWPSNSGSQFKLSFEGVQDKFVAYIEHCEETERVPMMGGFAVFCGITNDTLSNYSRRGDTDEERKQWRKLIDYIRDYIEDWKWSKAYTGELSQKIFSLDMINHHRKVTARTINDNKTELELSGKAGTTTTLAAVLESADGGGLKRRIGPGTAVPKQIPCAAGTDGEIIELRQQQGRNSKDKVKKLDND